MKLILSLDIQQNKSGYTFTLHNDKKATTFKNKTIPDGLDKVKELIHKIENQPDLGYEAN